jgi:hypothetical protein
MDVCFNNVLKAYRGLEAEVQKTIRLMFGEMCALCTSTCCTPDICEESLDSAFLRALRAAYQKDAGFCDRYGWLTELGCALECGRPPVCYGFFCNEIVDSLSDNEQRIVRVLGHIVSGVGEKAVGNSHLVEIMDSDDLKQLNCERIIKRIDAARLTLANVRKELNIS